MTRRYFVPDLPKNGGLVGLPDSEVQHATRVMRVQIGDEVTLFDGKGYESLATIASVSRHECQCDAGPAEGVDREPQTEIHLGVALPKPDRSRELIERLTELGVKSVTPLTAERTQRPPSESLIEKLKRGVIEACKQCGRNELLQVRPTQSALTFFSDQSESVRLIAHPSAEAVPLDRQFDAAVTIAAVGPEGGWTDGEFQFATEHGFKPIQLGARIYRIETAATVIASVLAT